ncbi:MAG: hypothetical protein AABW58_02745 [Nanoarchaeota archaeon]
MKKIIFLLLLLISLANVFSQQQLSSEGLSEDFSKNEEVILYVVESSSVRIGNPKEESFEKHKFKIVEILQDSVNLSIDNKQNTVFIPIAQTRKGDVDKDSVFDVSFTLNGIRGGIASITIKPLDDKVEEFKSTTPSIPITDVSQETQPETIETAQTQETTEEQLQNQDTQEQAEDLQTQPKKLIAGLSSNLLYMILGGAAIVLIIIGLVMFLLLRKNKPKDTNPW